MQPHIPVYFYFEKYKAKYALGECFGHTTKNYGAAHGEEVTLIFKTMLRDEVPYTKEELKVANLFVRMYEQWARESVAKFGNYEIPLSNDEEMLRYLELNYPKSELRWRKQMSDEEFWNQIDFNEGIPINVQQVKDEL